MAKGQQRSSREAKKPKQNKDKSGGGSAYKAEYGSAGRPNTGQSNPGAKPPGSK